MTDEQVKRTVTLSDGSVWEYEPKSHGGTALWVRRSHPSFRDHVLADGLTQNVPFVFSRSEYALTASDHRAIADVLEPTGAVAPPPTHPDAQDAERWRKIRPYLRLAYVGTGTWEVFMDAGEGFLSNVDGTSAFAKNPHDATVEEAVDAQPAARSPLDPPQEGTNG